MRGSRVALMVVVALLGGVLALATVGAALAWGPGGPGARFGGMMGGYGPGGMMGGYGPGGWCPGAAGGGPYGQGAQPTGSPISFDQAVQSVQSYLNSTGNQDLALHEVMEFEHNFYAIVEEKSTGIGAFELLVDKYTGRVYPEMGPNMMWNTKYGMMAGYGPGIMGGRGMMGAGGMMGRGVWGGAYGANPSTPEQPMTVTPAQATEAAQKWLEQYQPGTTTEEPDRFYGYYTLHTLKDGKISGMLSVNGYTGQVWYHSWHGDFVQAKDMEG